VEKTFDVIVVGAGPGGSSIAALLSRSGASTLLLDKAYFPRDKVCGDGLTPRALYWLDVLGCLDEVIGATRSCITQADLFINGERSLTGSFPASGPYPGFCIILRRKVLDHILVRHAVAGGAAFRPGSVVKGLRWLSDRVMVEAVSDGAPVCFNAKIVIGADGANSMVSRALGNRIMEGATAVSLRGYYEGLPTGGGAIQVHFDEPFFPGYGWLFADDTGTANVGVGYAVDHNFPLRDSLHQIYQRFVTTNLRQSLKNARPSGKPKGGWSSFFRPAALVKDRVLLIGDAANLGDPISGGGIHMALESAHVAAPVVLDALGRGDASAASLGRYETAWNQKNELDWRVGDLFLTIAKNPDLREFWLHVLNLVAAMAKNDDSFRDFAGGIFSGAVQSRNAFSPALWWQIAAMDPRIWLSAGAPVSETLLAARRALASPLPTAGWVVEVLTKFVRLAECYTRSKIPVAPAERRPRWPSVSWAL
jgi:geranylgeranyl reductase family protein